jgi:hypothetical protein
LHSIVFVCLLLQCILDLVAPGMRLTSAVEAYVLDACDKMLAHLFHAIGSNAGGAASAAASSAAPQLTAAATEAAVRALFPTCPELGAATWKQVRKVRDKLQETALCTCHSTSRLLGIATSEE